MNTRNPWNFLARSAYQPFPRSQRIRFVQAHHATVDRCREREDASRRAQGVGEQRVRRGIAADDAVQHDDVGTRQGDLRTVANLERGTFRQAALLRKRAGVRDRASAQVEARYRARTATEGCEGEISGAAPDVEHGATLEARFVQRVEQGRGDGGGRLGASRAFWRYLRPTRRSNTPGPRRPACSESSETSRTAGRADKTALATASSGGSNDPQLDARRDHATDPANGTICEATPRGSPPALPRPCPRGGVPGGPLSAQPRQRPLRVPGRDRPVDRVGDPPAAVHAGAARAPAGHADPVRRVHPDAGPRLRVHLHPLLPPRLGMDLVRDRRRDAS